MGKIDAEAVKASRSIDSVISDYVELKPNGREFEALCPFHKEKTPSFRIVPDKDFYYCFGCGASGDSIDFVQEITGASFKDACEVIAGNLNIQSEDVPKRESTRVDYYEKYNPLNINPDQKTLSVGREVRAINPKRDHKVSTFNPQYVWPYHNQDGTIAGFVIRIEINGKKITPTLRWCEYDGKQGWVMYPLGSENRPLFNLPSIIGSDHSRQVVIVEGEKAAQHLQQVVGTKLIVTCWAGGTNAVNRTDWSVLAGRRILLIPDNDEVGRDAMTEINGILIKHGAADIKAIIPPDDLPKGWDVADREWASLNEFIDWARDNIGKLPSHNVEDSPEPEYIPAESDSDDINQAADDYYSEPPMPEQQTGNEPFRMLGYSGEYFFFMPDSSQQIRSLTASQLAQTSNLLTLAPLDHWKTYAGLSPDEKIKPEHWQMHVNGLVQRSYSAGVFDTTRIRGRGAWIDKNRNLLHVGDTVYIDGQPQSPETIDSFYIYPRDLDMNVHYVKPASNTKAHDLVKICEKLSWERDLSGQLLAGWCVIAPLCGMLDWRPHIWVTGVSGAGKSTVLNSIIGVMIGEIGVRVEGKTTEAGIRQMLQSDARPILFDEAEAEDEAAARRMQGILDFARVSSSGGKIIKGSAQGNSIEFVARSAFCFSSINTSVKHLADEARITKLVLTRDATKTQAYWDDLESKIYELITAEYADSMISRSIYYMGTIKQNIKVFTRAATTVFKSRRIADQIGTMLAGTYLCYSTNVIEYDAAKEWIERFDWSDHTIVSAKPDHERMMELLTTKRIMITAKHERYDITIGEAIIIASRIDAVHPLDAIADDCDAELKRYGIRATHSEVTFSTSGKPIAKILAGTPWESSWGKTLADINGSEKTQTVYFCPGLRSRGVSIPISYFTE